MSRTPARCSQADIARAIRAVSAAGVPMAIEILPDGTIRLTPCAPPSPVVKVRRLVI
jgi:hypothetical protein